MPRGKRIGVLNVPSVQQGARQLSESIIEVFRQDSDNEYIVINQDAQSPSYSGPRMSTVSIPSKSSPPVGCLQFLLRCFGIWWPVGRFRAIRAMDLDILLATPTASPAGLYAGVPSICWIGDAMHLLHPDMPEYRWRVRLMRSMFYPSAARGAQVVVTESGMGCRQLSELFLLDPNRVRSVALIAPRYISENRAMGDEEARRILEGKDLPAQFLFYPAQFWPHKNHLNVVRALARIRGSAGERIPLVLAGSDKGYQSVVLKECRRLGVSDQVYFLGYVSDLEIVALYKRCTAMIFASIIGPTSIPPVEAMALGVPFLCSGVYAMPEQVGSAAVLFDPYSPDDIAEKIKSVWNDPQLRARLGREGLIRSKEFSAEAYAEGWRNVLAYALKLLGESGPKVTAGSAPSPKS